MVTCDYYGVICQKFKGAFQPNFYFQNQHSWNWMVALVPVHVLFFDVMVSRTIWKTMLCIDTRSNFPHDDFSNSPVRDKINDSLSEPKYSRDALIL